MALPVTITSFALSVGRWSYPFISSGGDVYVIAPTLNTNLKAFKATDPTSSFSEQTGGPTLANLTHYDCVQDGDLLHIASNDNSDETVEYHKFNMGTDTWDTTNELVSDNSGMTAPSDRGVSIAIRGVSGDELVVAYNAVEEPVMGTNYSRIDIKHKDKTASSWTGPISTDDGGEVGYYYPSLLTGASNRVHVLYGEDLSSGPVVAKTLSTSNTLSTAATGSTNLSTNINGGLSHSPFTFDDSGTQRLRWARSSTDPLIFMLQENASTGNAEWETTETVDYSDNAANNNSATIAWETGTTIHSLYSRSSDSDLYYDTSTNGGTTWGTDTLEVTGAGAIQLVYSKIYSRSGTTRLAFVYNDGGNTKYNEKDLGGAPPVTRRIFLIS